tara:strand:+ start:3888 stop:4034 length:147 start_codon:yes stop_codon:yes gene_type:complete
MFVSNGLSYSDGEIDNPSAYAYWLVVGVNPVAAKVGHLRDNNKGVLSR